MRGRSPWRLPDGGRHERHGRRGGQELDVDMSASDIFSTSSLAPWASSSRGRATGAWAATPSGCRSGPTAPRGPVGRDGQRRHEPGRIRLLRLAPPRALRRPVLRRPHQLPEQQSPHQRPAPGAQRRRFEDMVRPMVGLQLRTPENGKRWHAQVYTEIGGFGVGSDFAWQCSPRSASACRRRPRSSSASAGSTSTTRPARTRRSSSTTCSRRPHRGLRVQVLTG